MGPPMLLAPEAAHQLGLVPVAWLTALWTAGRRPSPRWWGLAAAFGVSWVADWVSHGKGTFPVGPPYLFAQASLFALVLAPHPWRFIVVLAFTALFAILNLDLTQPDSFVHTVAWLGLLAVTWPGLTVPLRWTLGVAFGLGWVAWMGYCLRPGWGSWLTYQSVRAASLGLFCWTSWKA